MKFSPKGKGIDMTFDGVLDSIVTFFTYQNFFNPIDLGFHLERNDFRKVVESCSGRGTSSIFTVWQKIVCERTDRKEFCRLV